MLSGVRFCLILSGTCPAGCVCKSLLCPASPWAPWRTSCPPTSLNPEQGEELLRERGRGAECRGPRVRLAPVPRRCGACPSSQPLTGSVGHTLRPHLACLGRSSRLAGGYWSGPCAFSLPAVPMAPVTLCAEAGVLSKILGHKSQKPDSNLPERRNGFVSARVQEVEGAGFRHGWLQGPQARPLGLCPRLCLWSLRPVCWPPSPTAHPVMAP